MDRHHEDEPLEGDDFFFDYASRRSGMTSTLEMRPDDDYETVAASTAVVAGFLG
jgi:hypothetical protein